MKLVIPHMTAKLCYDETNVKWDVKKKAGVYLIFNDDMVIYVGKSINTQERILAHLSFHGETNRELYGEITSCHKPFVQVVYEKDEEERSRLENIFYDYYYHPIHNKQRPDRFD